MTQKQLSFVPDVESTVLYTEHAWQDMPNSRSGTRPATKLVDAHGVLLTIQGETFDFPAGEEIALSVDTVLRAAGQLVFAKNEK